MIQELLAAKLATRLEAVLEAQLDKALDAALDMALDRLLGTDTQAQAQAQAQAKAKTKTSKKPQAEQPQAEQPKPVRVRVEPTPTHPTSYEEFTNMLVATGLGQSKSGKDLAVLWGNRASALRKYYEEKHGIPVPWQRLWAMVSQDKHLPTRVEGNARELAKALGLPVGE